MSTYRWRVTATCPGADADLKRRITERAGREPEFSSGASCGTDLPESSQFQWFFETKREADAFAKDLGHFEGCRFESREWEETHG